MTLMRPTLARHIHRHPRSDSVHSFGTTSHEVPISSGYSLPGIRLAADVRGLLLHGHDSSRSHLISTARRRQSMVLGADGPSHDSCRLVSA